MRKLTLTMILCKDIKSNQRKRNTSQTHKKMYYWCSMIILNESFLWELTQR